MSKVDIREVLRATSLFAGMTDDQLDQVEQLLEERRYMPGDQIIEAGSLDKGSMWIIVEGEAEVRRGNVSVHRFRPGDYFGELAVVSKESTRRSADVFASGVVKAVEFQRGQLRDLLAQAPDAALAMLAELAKRLRRTTERLLELHDKVAGAEAGSSTGTPKVVAQEDQYGWIARGLISPPISRFGPGRQEG